MVGEPIEKFIISECTRRASSCTCGLLFHRNGKAEVGTGTLIEHEGGRFILTCHHVARPVLSDPQSDIVFEPRNLSLASDHLEVYQWDEDDDLALLQVAAGPLAGDRCGLEPRTIRDLEAIDDLRPMAGSDRFVLVGMPAVEVRQRERGVALRPLTYFTVGSQNKPSHRERLVLDYPAHAKKPYLPRSDGLSGSVILRIPGAEQDKLWAPGPVVAMLYEGDEDSYVACRSLGLVIDWLEAFPPVGTSGPTPRLSAWLTMADRAKTTEDLAHAIRLNYTILENMKGHPQESTSSQAEWALKCTRDFVEGRRGDQSNGEGLPPRVHQRFGTFRSEQLGTHRVRVTPANAGGGTGHKRA